MKNNEPQINGKKINNKILVLIIIILLIIILLLVSKILLNKAGYVETLSQEVAIIELTEGDVNWDLLEQLNIFKKYEKIFPGAYGEYEFEIKNTTNSKLIYDIQLKEINNYNINMKYKIKTKQGKYLVGNEKSGINVDKVNMENIIINPNESEKYVLEWKWEDAENDAQIGEVENADYTLRIKIGAEQFI